MASTRQGRRLGFLGFVRNGEKLRFGEEREGIAEANHGVLCLHL